ncbi:hypothetical protein MGU_11076 [Metarhizium guizhouense ARSEF 977]|uniref:Uncharacterized protein n=1 Tax=Metarhizium guizhouense (strain ARSEF 977) TaxID=1276136 RepID=A0A0B4G4S5_METGA|nr:hypothetical protein MGU_11076 [Metarhizium guizhouense ARSEF 977]
MLAPGRQRSGLQGDIDCNERGADGILDNDPDSRVQDQQESNQETEQEVERGVAREIGKEIRKEIAKEIAKEVAREIAIAREIGREIGKEIASAIAGEIPREATQEDTREATQEVIPRDTPQGDAPQEVIPGGVAPREIAPQQVVQNIQQPVNQRDNQKIQLLSATMTRTSLRSSWRLQLTFPHGSESLVDEFCTEFNRNLSWSHILKRKASSAYILDAPDPPDPALGCRVILPVNGLVQVAPVPIPTLHFGSKRAAKIFKKHAYVFEHPPEDAESQKSLYMPAMSIDAFREKLSSRGSRVWSWWPNPNSHLHSGAF